MQITAIIVKNINGRITESAITVADCLSLEVLIVSIVVVG